MGVCARCPHSASAVVSLLTSPAWLASALSPASLVLSRAFSALLVLAIALQNLALHVEFPGGCSVDVAPHTLGHFPRATLVWPASRGSVYFLVWGIWAGAVRPLLRCFGRVKGWVWARA